MFRSVCSGVSAVAVLALLGACGPGDQGAPAGQTYVTELAVTATERAWVSGAEFSTVYWQARGQPPRVVQAESDPQWGLLLAREGLYFCDDSRLFLWPRGAENPAILYRHNGLPRRPVLDEQNVYFPSTAPESSRNSAGRLMHQVRAFPRDGSPSFLAFERLHQILQLTVDADTFYWIEMDDHGDDTLWQAPKNGGDAQLRRPLTRTDVITPVLYLSTDHDAWLPGSQKPGLTRASGLLYLWSTTGREGFTSQIEVTPKEGSESATLIRGDFVGAGIVFDFDPSGPRLFGVTDKNGQPHIESVPLDGGAPTLLAPCKAYCSTLVSFEGVPMWSDQNGLQPAGF